MIKNLLLTSTDLAPCNILQELPAMVYISDNASKTIQWCNKNMEEETGYTLNEMKQMGWNFFKKIMHPDDFSLAVEAQQGFIMGKTLFGGACRIRAKKQRHWKWFLGLAIPYSYTNYLQIKEVICVFQNLSLALDTPSQIGNALRSILQSYHQPLLDMLTDREKAILRLLKEGNKAPDIAKKLFISHNTVQTHLHHLHEKLQVHSTAALVKTAFELGL